VCLTWHPDKQLLAIAWQDGAVSIWDAAKCHLEEDSKAHRQSICQLLWHPDGKHFMTADVQGTVRHRAQHPRTY
jgi:WD40 repeat protein